MSDANGWRAESKSMKLGQVIYSSRGNSASQLVARSQKIDDRLAGAIAEYCPLRNSLEYKQRTTSCFFELPQDRFVVMRSVVGPASDSMERQIITNAVVLERYQLGRLNHDATAVLHLLRTQGHLILQVDPSPILPDVEIPDRCIDGQLASQVLTSDIERVTKVLPNQQYVGLQGVKHPMSLLSAVIQAAETEAQRTELTFCIGRRANDVASERKAFRIYVHYAIDQDLSRELVASEIRPIEMRPERANA